MEDDDDDWMTLVRLKKGWREGDRREGRGSQSLGMNCIVCK